MGGRVGLGGEFSNQQQHYQPSRWMIACYGGVTVQRWRVEQIMSVREMGREKHADEKGGRILGESKEGEERWIKRVGKVEEGEGER